MQNKGSLFRYFLAVLILTFTLSGTCTARAQSLSLEFRDGVWVSTKEIKGSDQYIEINMKIPVIEGMEDKKIQAKINASLERDAVDFKSKTR